MKKRSFLYMAVMAFVLGVGSVSASAQGQVLKADIPFEFMVGKTKLPAGEYTVTLPQTGGAATVSLRGTEDDTFALALTNWVNAKKADIKDGLTFVRSGDRYFLYQIHVPGREIGQELVRSKQLFGNSIAKKTVDLKPARTE